MFSIFASGKITWYHSPLNLAVFIYVFIIIISAIGTNHLLVSAKTTSRSLAYILVGFGITRYMIIDRNLLKNILTAMFVMGVFLVVYGFYTQIAAGVAVYQDIALPFFKNHCIYAEYLCIIFAVLLAFTLGYGKTKGKAFLISGSILFACAILMTFVRGAWLAIFALLSYTIVIQGRKAPFKLIAIFLVLMIAAGGFALTMDLTELLTQRINRLMDFRYVTNFDRIDRWMAAVSMFLHHPILGVGYGNYPEEYYRHIWFVKATTLTDRMGAHNLYLEILAETGFLGLVAFLGLIVTFFRESLKLIKELNDSFWNSLTIGVMGAMLTYLVHGVVNNLGPSDKLELLFWILIGMPILIRKLAFDKI
jgi:O-antigen ligase